MSFSSKSGKEYGEEWKEHTTVASRTDKIKANFVLLW